MTDFKIPQTFWLRRPCGVTKCPGWGGNRMAERGRPGKPPPAPRQFENFPMAIGHHCFFGAARHTDVRIAKVVRERQ